MNCHSLRNRLHLVPRVCVESEPLKFFTGPVYAYDSNAKVSATFGSLCRLCNPATCTLIHLLLLANELPQLEHANKRNVMVNSFVD